jgi:hypothetical protein
MMILPVDPACTRFVRAQTSAEPTTATRAPQEKAVRTLYARVHAKNQANFRRTDRRYPVSGRKAVRTLYARTSKIRAYHGKNGACSQPLAKAEGPW